MNRLKKKKKKSLSIEQMKNCKRSKEKFCQFKDSFNDVLALLTLAHIYLSNVPLDNKDHKVPTSRFLRVK